MRALAVVYDACVLYPAPLRDLLMHLAAAGLCRAKWTATIHDEWIRSVLANRPDLKPEHLQRTRELMDAHALDCLVSGFESRIAELNLPDPADRHVVAAAIHCEATVILTFNLSDFPQDTLRPHGIEAVHPDPFLVNLFDLSPDRFCEVARGHRANLKNPPKSAVEYLLTLEAQRLPQIASRLRQCMDLI